MQIFIYFVHWGWYRELKDIFMFSFYYVCLNHYERKYQNVIVTNEDIEWWHWMVTFDPGATLVFNDLYRFKSLQ